MASDVTRGPVINDSIQEVQGIFPSDAALQDAIGRLTRAGFDRAALSLPAANPAPSQATPAAGAENPDTEDDMRQSRTLHTSMAASVGAMVGAGVTVATGGAALLAAAAAVGLGAAAGGAVSAAHAAVDHAKSEDRNLAAAAGELVLSAAAPNDEAVARARAAMQEAGASRVEAVTRTGGAIS
jgi:isopropylmalate/homocitrate/citramalate synthase